MSKIEDINFIKKTCESEDITAYKIANMTGLSSVGIQKILNGETKNPNSSTIKLILDYLKSETIKDDKIIISDIIEKYKGKNIELIKIYECEKERNILYNEVINLQKKLRDNNIEFKDYFEFRE